MKSYIQLAIRTKSETIDPVIGENLIDSLAANEGLLLPEMVSNSADKFTDSFLGRASCAEIWASSVSIRINGALSNFHQDFAWTRRKVVKSTGSVVHTSRNVRGQLVPGSVSLNSAYSDKVDWYSLFRSWCEIFPPQLGMLHLFTGPELGQAEKNGSFQIGSFNAALRPDIPNVGWAMFYGDEFSHEVDANLIVASGFHVDRMANGYLVRVTKRLQDVQDDFRLFSRRRAELKSLFREGLFLINDEPSI